MCPNNASHCLGTSDMFVVVIVDFLFLLTNLISYLDSYLFVTTTTTDDSHHLLLQAFACRVAMEVLMVNGAQPIGMMNDNKQGGDNK
jgi:hypothetical protein